MTQGVKNLMPFIHRLHYSLALGTVGSYIFGIIALLWTLDCFVGAYITFPPPSQKKRTPKEWLHRWKPSWLVRANKLFSFIFTFHRASGLWIWAMLFVFAWSSVGFNLREVYNPVMKAVFGDTGGHQIEDLDEPLKTPDLSWREAYTIGQNHLAELSKEQGFKVEWERDMRYYPNIGAYILVVNSSLDIGDKFPFTAVYMDGNTGELLRFHAPTGQNTGSTVATWLFRMHMADIKTLGLPYRIFVTLLGIVITFLSVSGVWIWLKKRRKKKPSRKNVKISNNQNGTLNGSDRKNKKPTVQTSGGEKVGAGEL
ncbi:MAG: PepSY-associated TM helix domain-containing protein [Cyclobacteriaceae bacterium]